MIDARALHGWLGVGKRFTTWIKARIEEYSFSAHEDFFPILGETGTRGGRPRTDYFLTIDMAKELAMVERTEVGRVTRRYAVP